MVRHTSKILQHLPCVSGNICVSDHFGALCIKGLKLDAKIRITFCRFKEVRVKEIQKNSKFQQQAKELSQKSHCHHSDLGKLEI